MIKQLRAAALAFLIFTVITGVIYPVVVTVIGQVIFPVQANGSLIERDGQVVGSAWIGQQVDDPRYFSARPSAANSMQGSSPDALIASSGSNAGWTNAGFAETVQVRSEALRATYGLSADAPLPPDLVFASGSGLDPHISPEAAAIQIDRVATARGVDRAVVVDLVARYTEAPQLVILGQTRVNVLLLNLALADLE